MIPILVVDDDPIVRTMTPTVLVVDDDKGFLQMMREVLEEEGYTVSTAEHGGPALDRMRASQEPLLVLLGLVMPVLDGEGVLEEVAADPALASRHRVIMVTAAYHRATSGRVAGSAASVTDPGGDGGPFAHHVAVAIHR